MQLAKRYWIAVTAFMLTLLPATMPGPGWAEGYREIMQRRPDLFDTRTGYRIARHRAPSPDDIPLPARTIEASEVEVLIKRGAILVDVFGALQSRYDELNGRWLVAKPRMSLPGATWLPQTGLGVLSEPLQRYLKTRLQELTGGDQSRPVVVFCVADCWMSWNAAQRVARLGYRNVYWLRHGTDGWLDHGGSLVPVRPLPVTVE